MVVSSHGATLIRAVYPSGRGGSHGDRGGYQGARGGTQVSKIEGLLGAQPGSRCNQIYVVLARLEAETLDVLITITILVCHKLGLFLFDPELTYSYTSAYYASRLELTSDLLPMPLRISTLVGDFLILIEYSNHVL